MSDRDLQLIAEHLHEPLDWVRQMEQKYMCGMGE